MRRSGQQMIKELQLGDPNSSHSFVNLPDLRSGIWKWWSISQRPRIPIPKPNVLKRPASVALDLPSTCWRVTATGLGSSCLATHLQPKGDRVVFLAPGRKHAAVARPGSTPPPPPSRRGCGSPRPSNGPGCWPQRFAQLQGLRSAWWHHQAATWNACQDARNARCSRRMRGTASDPRPHAVVRAESVARRVS